MKTLPRYFIENVLSYGMIASLLMIVVQAAVYLLDVDQTIFRVGVFNFVYNIVVFSICIYCGTIAYRKKTSTGNLTYGDGVLFCITISFVTIILINVYSIIFHVFIDPDFLSRLIEPQLAAISSNPSIPPMKKMELVEKLQKRASPFYNISFNAVISLGICVIISLITAIFTVRKRPIVLENIEENN